MQNGFQAYKTFKNPKYSNYYDDGFKKFGTIHWEPSVLTDTNGNFTFAIPNIYSNEIKIIIEGISSDGRLISESRTIKN